LGHPAEPPGAYDVVVSDDDYSDIELCVLRSGAGPAIHALRPMFPRWRHHLLANGVERVSKYDAKASNIMTLLIVGQKGGHNLRNILSRQGAPTFQARGWKN
jgi:hypothetical protein